MVESWHDFFVALAGATAALTGLLFVAVSINLDRILSIDGLPERALESLVLLLATLIVSLLSLVPDQSSVALGIELLVIGLGLGAFIAKLRHGAVPMHAPKAVRVALPIICTLPLLIGGALLASETADGLLWVVGAAVAAILTAVSNAWVLLVEILR